MKRIFTGLLSLIPILTIAQIKQELLKTGQVINLSIETSQVIDMGMGMEMAGDVSGIYELTIADVIGDSLYLVLSKMNSTKVKASGMGQDQSYDSETGVGENSELGASLKDRIGKVDTLKINRYTGQVAGSVSEETSGSPNPLNSSTGDLASISENTFFLLQSELKTGKKWSMKSKTNGVDSETEYELKSLENKIATIEYKTKVNGSYDTDIQGTPVTVTTMGTIAGVFTSNIETGYILRKTLDSDLTSTMDMADQTLEMSVKGKTTVTNTLK